MGPVTVKNLCPRLCRALAGCLPPPTPKKHEKKNCKRSRSRRPAAGAPSGWDPRQPQRHTGGGGRGKDGSAAAAMERRRCSTQGQSSPPRRAPRPPCLSIMRIVIVSKPVDTPPSSRAAAASHLPDGCGGVGHLSLDSSPALRGGGRSRHSGGWWCAPSRCRESHPGPAGRLARPPLHPWPPSAAPAAWWTPTGATGGAGSAPSQQD